MNTMEGVAKNTPISTLQSIAAQIQELLQEIKQWYPNKESTPAARTDAYSLP